MKRHCQKICLPAPLPLLPPSLIEDKARGPKKRREDKGLKNEKLSRAKFFKTYFGGGGPQQPRPCEVYTRDGVGGERPLEDAKGGLVQYVSIHLKKQVKVSLGGYIFHRREMYEFSFIK